MLTIALCGGFVMINEDGEDLGSVNIATHYLLTFIILIPGFLLYLNTRRQHNVATPIKWMAGFLLWMTFISFIFSDNLKSAIYPCLTSLLPFAAMCSMYAYTSKYGMHKSIIWAAVLMQLILVIQYFRIYNIANAVGEAHLMTSYYPMFLLPLVLIHPSKAVRYLSILLITFVIFSSIKRGGLVALVIALIVYILSKERIQSKGIKSILYVVLALVTLGGIFMYFTTTEYGGVIERMASIQDDGGSGRTDVWATTWSMIQNTEGLKYLIGHGFSTVLRDSPLFLSAHNDFMEAWYDFGIIGCLLYIFSLLSTARYSLQHLKIKSQTAPCLLMLLSLMLVDSSISIVILYFLLTLCCMMIGIFLGLNYYNTTVNINNE